jgi:hypothetical protein
MSLFHRLRSDFETRLAEELAAHPAAALRPLTESDLAPLPPPVRRYVRRSGAVGKPQVDRVRVEWRAKMYRKPGEAPMDAPAVQVSFFAGPPVRLFFMTARMKGLPVQVFHDYRGEAASMRVRAALLFDVVDLAGEAFSRGETVTVLNDMCFFAPGTLVDPRLTWAPVDDRSARVTFKNGRHVVEATLRFDEADELVDFWSDDRPALVDGKLRPYRWRTPLSGYRAVQGRWLAARGSVVYEYPEGPFTYGEFEVRSISFEAVGPLKR